MRYIALWIALSGSPAFAAKCEGELFAWTYRKVINHTGLVRFLVLNPGAVFLARELGVSLRHIDYPFRLDGVFQFTDRLAVEMNRTLRSPFRMLKRKARGRPEVLAYVAELEARARAAGLECEWFRPGVRQAGARSDKRIYLNAVHLVQPFALTQCLHILTHELNHQPPVRPRRAYPNEPLDVFTERFIADRATEELRVRRLDRRTRERLREIGLRFPTSAVPRDTLAIWRADEAGEPEGKLLQMVRKLGETAVRERARRYWLSDADPP